MSTDNLNIQAKRFLLLSQLDEKIFHASDLANLWQIKEQNTLYTTLKRYVKSGLLFRIYKGLYAILPTSKLDPLLLGAKALHQYCYLSTETVLYQHGYISQTPNAYTFIAAKSQKIAIDNTNYVYRRMKEQYLMNNLEIDNTGSVNIASPERAIADMLYFNPFFHFDKKINWHKIKKIQKKLGYPLTPKRYDFTLTG